MNDEPKCDSCGVLFIEHMGIIGTCAELTRLRLELAAANEKLAALSRGEFICKSCGIRKDGEGDRGDF